MSCEAGGKFASIPEDASLKLSQLCAVSWLLALCILGAWAAFFTSFICTTWWTVLDVPCKAQHLCSLHDTHCAEVHVRVLSVLPWIVFSAQRWQLRTMECLQGDWKALSVWCNGGRRVPHIRLSTGAPEDSSPAPAIPARNCQVRRDLPVTTLDLPGGRLPWLLQGQYAMYPHSIISDMDFSYTTIPQ